VSFDIIIGRNVFTHLADKIAAARTIKNLLKPNGRLTLAEIVPRHTQRLSPLLDLSSLAEGLLERVLAAEEAIYAKADDPMVNWDGADLQAILEKVGFSDVEVKLETVTSERHIGAGQLQRWFVTEAKGQRATLAQHLAQQGVTPTEVAQLKQLFEQQLLEQVVPWRSTIAYVVLRS
jgi:putative ATPase